MSRPRSDIEPRLIEAARARFLSEGVDGASLRDIARDAETNIGMVAYYFGTKDRLFLAVVEDVYATIVTDLTRILQTDGAALERLRHGFIRLGTASDVELDVLRLIIREALGSTKRLRQIVRRFMRGHIPLLVETVKDGVRRGEFDRRMPIPLLLLAVFGIGALPQVVRRASSLRPMLSSLPDPEKLARLSTDLLSRTIGPTRLPRSRVASGRQSRE
jgi:AcrR family transcriptional regulator